MFLSSVQRWLLAPSVSKTLFREQRSTLVPLVDAVRSISLQQMHERGVPKRRPQPKSPMQGHPQLRAVVLKVLIKKPKKPNSANRKCALVKLSTGKETVAWIPGEGHNLQEHSQVMVEGGRKQDLIGVKIRIIRGKLDCAPVIKTPKPT